MINVYKDEHYITIGTNKGVYLVSCGRVLAFKPSPKEYNYYSMIIDKQLFTSFITCSNEIVNKLMDCVSRFCGRTPTNIVTKVNNNEFAVKDLQDMF